MTAPARIAVIIPCFNEAELVAEAARSVRESEPVDVIVVDDASTDERTHEVLDELEGEGVTVIRHELNGGLIATRMTGLAAAKTRLVFNLDADDLAVDGALAAMADRLDAEPRAAVCYGDFLEFGDNEALRPAPPHLDPYRLAYTNEYPASAMFRREALIAIGGWRAAGYEEPAYEDWNLWLTLAERQISARHFGAAKPTYRRRLHGERMLTSAKRDHRRLYGALRAHHEQLFSNLKLYRRRSDLGAIRKLLYPLVYGGRRRFAFERRVKAALDRTGFWTLRR